MQIESERLILRNYKDEDVDDLVEGLNVTDFYVTDGLKKKLLENWETPNKEEIGKMAM